MWDCRAICLFLFPTSLLESRAAFLICVFCWLMIGWGLDAEAASFKMAVLSYPILSCPVSADVVINLMLYFALTKYKISHKKKRAGSCRGGKPIYLYSFSVYVMDSGKVPVFLLSYLLSSKLVNLTADFFCLLFWVTLTLTSDLPFFIQVQNKLLYGGLHLSWYWSSLEAGKGKSHFELGSGFPPPPNKSRWTRWDLLRSHCFQTVHRELLTQRVIECEGFCLITVPCQSTRQIGVATHC